MNLWQTFLYFIILVSLVTASNLPQLGKRSFGGDIIKRSNACKQQPARRENKKRPRDEEDTYDRTSDTYYVLEPPSQQARNDNEYDLEYKSDQIIHSSEIMNIIDFCINELDFEGIKSLHSQGHLLPYINSYHINSLMDLNCPLANSIYQYIIFAISQSE